MGSGPKYKPNTTGAPPMPLDPTVIEARRRALKKQRSGRLATILTTPKGVLSRGVLKVPSLLGGSGTMAQG